MFNNTCIWERGKVNHQDGGGLTLNTISAQDTGGGWWWWRG